MGKPIAQYTDAELAQAHRDADLYLRLSRLLRRFAARTYSVTYLREVADLFREIAA